jgi:hypothetical protein
MKKILLFLIVAVVMTFSTCTTDKAIIKIFPVKAGDKWGYVDKTGQYIINSQFEEAFNFSEGLALVKSTNGNFGFISENGKYVINPIYKYANSFSEGMACVVMENGKLQFIDRNNKALFTVENAEYSFGFTEGMALVKIKGKYGFIDKNGKIVINPIYENAQPFREGLAAVAIKNEKNEILWGYIAKSGELKIDFQFDKGKFVIGSFNEGLAFISTDGEEWGYIDKEGNYRINPQFECDIWDGHGFISGVSIVYQDGSYGYIDKKGKYLINPQFKYAFSFLNNEIAAVQHSDGNWGFINKEGKYEINPQFEDVAIGFFGEVAFVKSSGKYGIINKKGKYILIPKFDDVRLYDIFSNYFVKTDYVDFIGIAEETFEKSSSTQFLGYDKNTTLGQIIEDYPDLDISDFNPYEIDIKKPLNTIRDLIEIDLRIIGFVDKTYKDIPVYRNVRKHDYWKRRYITVKEIVRWDRKIQKSARIEYISIGLGLELSGKGKGKTLAEALKNQAAIRMKVSELTDYNNKNTDDRGLFMLKNNDLFIYILYIQEENYEEYVPSITVIVWYKNYDLPFDDLAGILFENFDEL